MTPTFWTWATEHWFLTFILALMVLQIVRTTLKAVLAPLERLWPKPEPEETAAQTTEDAETEETETEETDEEDESEKEVQAVVVPTRRSRFDRL